MILSVPFPNIDPIIFSVGPIAVRWYALSYIAGLLIGIKYIAIFVSKSPYALEKRNVDDLLVWVTIGVILGGRIGYAAFYNLGIYLSNPIQILKIWEGGMSFHGGLVGVVCATMLFCRQRKLSFWGVSDAVACAAPIGLFFGRIANFINGELFGRVSDLPWAVIFPNGGQAPRHPSQLYEAFFEGLLLFAILFFFSKNDDVRHKSGFLSGIFLIGYGIARGFIEFFREPDQQIGFLFGVYTMGQLLSAPLIIFGIYLVFFRQKSK